MLGPAASFDIWCGHQKWTPSQKVQCWAAAGQNVSHIDSLFTGGQMGLQSDIADGRYAFRDVGQVLK